MGNRVKLAVGDVVTALHYGEGVVKDVDPANKEFCYLIRFGGSVPKAIRWFHRDSVKAGLIRRVGENDQAQV